MEDEPPKQLSMAAGAMVLKSVKLFISAGRAAAERKASQVQVTRPPGKQKSGALKKPSQKTMEFLLKFSKFNKTEIEQLYTMYCRLVAAAQASAASAVVGQPAPKIEGIDQNTFRDVMHTTFNLVTEDTILERIWVTWDRGVGSSEGVLKFDPWVRGLSVLLKGSLDEQLKFCFKVYDLNSDDFITKDEMFLLLKNALLKQPGDEDPDEGVRDLVELVLKKLDIDKDGQVSFEDYREAVHQDRLLLEAFGQCLPTKRNATAFLKTILPNFK